MTGVGLTANAILKGQFDCDMRLVNTTEKARNYLNLSRTSDDLGRRPNPTMKLNLTCYATVEAHA